MTTERLQEKFEEFIGQLNKLEGIYINNKLFIDWEELACLVYDFEDELIAENEKHSLIKR